METLNLELQNAVILELIACSFTKIEELNPSKCLNVLFIHTYNDLLLSASLDDIQGVIIHTGIFCTTEMKFPKRFANFKLHAFILRLQENKTPVYESSFA
jgi:hypothetical protein